MSDQGFVVSSGTLEGLVGDLPGVVGGRTVPGPEHDPVITCPRRALFLSECDGRDLKSLTLGEVTSFVVRQCPRFSVGRAKNLVTGLRSLLGYLYLEGLTDHQLALAVPTPSGWHGSNLPQWLGAVELAALLAGPDDGTAVGRRNHAIVVMLARLGLRAGEVAALTLDDVDWAAGEIVVRGKGDRTEALPLPVDVGEAVVGYLHDGRPPVACRALFLRAQAPLVGLSPPARGRRAFGLRSSRPVPGGCPSASSQRGHRHVAGRCVAGGGRSGVAPPQHAGHRPLRQGRLRRAAPLALPWPGDAA